MGNIIIVLILLLIVLLAVRSSRAHFKGEGGCCGGGSVPKPEKKRLEGKKIAEKVLYIEGMHCENCKNSVEKQLNRIEGVVARVDLKKQRAVVEMDREVAGEELIAAVERAGFKVVQKMQQG